MFVVKAVLQVKTKFWKFRIHNVTNKVLISKIFFNQNTFSIIYQYFLCKLINICSNFNIFNYTAYANEHRVEFLWVPFEADKGKMPQPKNITAEYRRLIFFTTLSYSKYCHEEQLFFGRLDKVVNDLTIKFYFSILIMCVWSILWNTILEWTQSNLEKH